eukprot:scaffold11091_cov75-Phaeocystis_antarctica.AAC.6
MSLSTEACSRLAASRACTTVGFATPNSTFDSPGAAKKLGETEVISSVASSSKTVRCAAEASLLCEQLLATDADAEGVQLDRAASSADLHEFACRYGIHQLTWQPAQQRPRAD